VDFPSWLGEGGLFESGVAWVGTAKAERGAFPGAGSAAISFRESKPSILASASGGFFFLGPQIFAQEPRPFVFQLVLLKLRNGNIYIIPPCPSEPATSVWKRPAPNSPNRSENCGYHRPFSITCGFCPNFGAASFACRRSITRAKEQSSKFFSRVGVWRGVRRTQDGPRAKPDSVSCVSP